MSLTLFVGLGLGTLIGFVWGRLTATPSFDPPPWMDPNEREPNPPTP